MTAEQEKALNKLQRIMALMNSPNDNERDAAAAKAAEFMTRHGLTLQEVREAGNPSEYIKSEPMDLGRERMAHELTYVRWILKHFFQVRTIYSLAVKSRTGELIKPSRLSFVGTKENVEIAEYVFIYLSAIFRANWKRYAKAKGLKTSSRASYYDGLYAGLYAKMQAAKESVQESLALVLVEDPKLNEFYGTLGVGKASKSVAIRRDASAERDGYQDGQKISIHSAIKEQGN